MGARGVVEDAGIQIYGLSGFPGSTEEELDRRVRQGVSDSGMGLFD